MGKYSHKREEQTQEEAKQKEALIDKILQEFSRPWQIIRRPEINEMLEEKAKSLISEIAQKLGRKIEAMPKCFDIGEGRVLCIAYITQLDTDPPIVEPYSGQINGINYEIFIYKDFTIFGPPPPKRLVISVKARI